MTTGSHAWQMLHWDLTPHLPSKMARHGGPQVWSQAAVSQFPVRALSVVFGLIIKPLEIDMNVPSSISICAGFAFWCILETSWNYDLVICVLSRLFLFGFCLGSVCPSKTVPWFHHCRCRCTGTVKARAARLLSAELMAAGKPGHPGSWR